MIKLNSKKIAEIVGSASVLVDADIDEVVTDSRVAKRGDLFIAIKGEKFDGHDFVKEVIDRGVELVIVQKLVPDANRGAGYVDCLWQNRALCAAAI